MGHAHDVWDVHASDGRWWVITNPTNLYSQNQFPSMDLAVTFHMGLTLRIPRGDLPFVPITSNGSSQPNAVGVKTNAEHESRPSPLR
jgi:hypothetical protein